MTQEPRGERWRGLKFSLENSQFLGFYPRVLSSEGKGPPKDKPGSHLTAKRLRTWDKSGWFCDHLLLKPAELQEIGTLLIAMKLTAVGKGPWYVSLLVQKKKKTKTSSIPEVQRTGDLSWLCWLQMLGWRFPVVSSILASGSLLPWVVLFFSTKIGKMASALSSWYWVGQKVPITSYRKTQMNFLAHVPSLWLP